MWVYNDDTNAMVQRDITFVPGLYKIFDEILGKIKDTEGCSRKRNNGGLWWYFYLTPTTHEI